jgi:hypothetical protein
MLVSYNSAAYLDPCLDSLFSCGLSRNFEVVVVDNGSTDGSCELLAERFPSVRVVRSGSNLGFAGATNLGASLARGEFVLLLNCDTVVNRKSLESMARFLLQNPNAGAVAGKLVNADGSFQSGFGRFPSLLEETLSALGFMPAFMPGYPCHRTSSESRQVDWVCAASLMIRRTVFEDVGGFDETFFMYSEEVDFLYRMHLAKWPVFYLPGVETIHLGGVSQDRRRRRKMVYRGKLLFFCKHANPIKSSLFRLLLGLISLAKASVWSLMSALGVRSRLAASEAGSNLDVLRLCWRLE